MLGGEKYFYTKSINDDSPYSDVSNSAYEMGEGGYKFLGPGDSEGNPGHDHAMLHMFLSFSVVPLFVDSTN